jgi:hypothetical protein
MLVAWRGQIWPSIGGFLPTTLRIEQWLPGQASATANHVSNDGLGGEFIKIKYLDTGRVQILCTHVLLFLLRDCSRRLPMPSILPSVFL